MRHRALALGLVWAALAGGIACSPRPQDIREFFPLGPGHQWIYQVTTPGQLPRRLEFHILGEGPGDRGESRFHLDQGRDRYYLRHGDRIAYSISPGIWTVFLEGPLRRGHRFDAAVATFEDALVVGEPPPKVDPEATPVPMRKVPSAGYKLVSALDRKITVPAGTFEGCVEITHVTVPMTGVKYYAPGIGMVFGEAWSIDRVTGNRALVSRQELVEYHVNGKSGGNASVLLPEGVSPAAPSATPELPTTP